MRRLIENWRYLHAHPEKSWHEHDTASWLAERCREVGLEPQHFGRFPGFTVDVGPQPRRVGLRADLDVFEDSQRQVEQFVSSIAER